MSLGCTSSAPRQNDRADAHTAVSSRSLADDGFLDGAASASATTSASASVIASASAPAAPEPIVNPDRAAVVRALGGRRARVFGPSIPGVVRTFTTDRDQLALTLDLCEGRTDAAFDEELFDLLHEHHIKATIFVSGKWAPHHATLVSKLEADPLFEVENHGAHHRPCSVDGSSAFGIGGTRDLASAVDEIEDNELTLETLIARRPKLYRSGTAYFDDVCVAAAAKLGVIPVGFSVSGDGGTGFTRSQVRRTLEGAKPGAIIVLHAHRPKRASAEGLADALPALEKRGVEFVLLSEVLGGKR
ncbi:MAG: polysaccharide deacetylase family protein [Polyangiaceae bacterium]